MGMAFMPLDPSPPTRPMATGLLLAVGCTVLLAAASFASNSQVAYAAVARPVSSTTHMVQSSQPASRLRPFQFRRLPSTATEIPTPDPRDVIPAGLRASVSFISLAMGFGAVAAALLFARRSARVNAPAHFAALSASSDCSVPPSVGRTSTTTTLFDPLELSLTSSSTTSAHSMTIAHGRLAFLLTGAGLSLLVAGQALAELEEPQFLSSTFEVEFAGMRVDHKLLITLVVLGQFIGFIGAYVGGTSSRARQKEAEVLARKLTAVNQQLRQNRRRAFQRKPLTVDNTEAGKIVRVLKDGKAMLKDKTRARESLQMFQDALKATQTAATLGEKRLDLQRKAFRGMGAALQQLGRYDGALKAIEEVLALTRQIGDQAGVTDAYGAMADILAESGQLAKAAKFYDLYIESLDAEMADESIEASRYRL